MGRIYNKIRSKAMGGVNGYCVYVQYGYHRSGIEGSIVSFKVTPVLEWIY